nr:immunoglobulin heavy chain junction region [Homo sapiens]
SANEQPESRGH